jgi:hypothetical protein
MALMPALVSSQTPLKRIRNVSRPLTILLSVALGLAIAYPLLVCGGLLLLHGSGSPSAYVSFTSGGPAIEVGKVDSTQSYFVPIDSLSLGQRAALACLRLLCSTCIALMLFHLRALFALYPRGVIIASENIRSIKGFGSWLVLSAIAINLSGRIFAAIIHAPPRDIANAALAVVYGAMIYVIAHVMEIGREADLERKDFI